MCFQIQPEIVLPVVVDLPRSVVGATCTAGAGAGSFGAAVSLGDFSLVLSFFLSLPLRFLLPLSFWSPFLSSTEGSDGGSGVVAFVERVEPVALETGGASGASGLDVGVVALGAVADCDGAAVVVFDSGGAGVPAFETGGVGVFVVATGAGGAAGFSGFIDDLLVVFASILLDEDDGCGDVDVGSDSTEASVSTVGSLMIRLTDDRKLETGFVGTALPSAPVSSMVSTSSRCLVLAINLTNATRVVLVTSDSLGLYSTWNGMECNRQDLSKIIEIGHTHERFVFDAKSLIG